MRDERSHDNTERYIGVSLALLALVWPFYCEKKVERMWPHTFRRYSVLSLASLWPSAAANQTRPAFIFAFVFACVNSRGHNGSDASLPSTGVNTLLTSSDDGNSEFMNKNNNNLDNGGVTEVCDVPDEIANQKRHVNRFSPFVASQFRLVRCITHFSSRLPDDKGSCHEIGQQRSGDFN